MTIGELSRTASVPITTLRYWEAHNLLPLPDRRNGTRTYDSSYVERVAVIKLAQRVGCSLGDIRQLLQAIDGGLNAATAWKALQAARLNALESIIVEASALRDIINAGASSCGCATLGECAIALGITEQEPGRKTAAPL